MTVDQVLTNAAARLKAAGVESAPMEAQLLLAHTLGVERLRLLIDRDRTVPAPRYRRFATLLKRRCRREPLQYIIGQTEFFGHTILVNNHVLIPRPETELLVEQVIKRWKREYRTVLDIGTGSGAIAIALAKTLPDAEITATDISARALTVARKNVGQHQLTDRVTLIKADLMPRTGTRFDCIVSNPPYIPSGNIAKLQPEVSRHEPHKALDGGGDGLYCYRTILKLASTVLNPGGLLALEIGQGQARAVKELAHRWLPGARVESIKDYCGIGRIVLAETDGTRTP